VERAIARILISGLLLTVSAAAGAEEALRPRKTVAQLPKVASSADGFVEVVAADVPGDPVGFRLPILQFCTREIRALEHTFQLTLPRGDVGLAVYAQDGVTNDTRVVMDVTKRRNRLLTRIWLPSPGHSDLEELRFAVARAYFAAWIDRNRPTARTVAGTLPDWVVQGALRNLERETAHDDVRFVLQLWSEGRLPFFPALCQDLRRARGKAAALPGYMVGLMREQRQVRPVLERLARGTAWNGATLARELTGVADPAEQDRWHDERMARLTRAVLSPGRASAWDVKVFTSRLLLYPAEFDKNTDAKRTPCTFRDAALRAAEDKAVRAAASRKAREVLFSALGRGDDLTAAAKAFHDFLVGVARGDEAATLLAQLEEAEALLKKAGSEGGAAAPEKR